MPNDTSLIPWLASLLLQMPISLIKSITNTHPKLTPPPPSDFTSPCRYRLDNEASSTITLPDGRTLGYAQSGSPTGRTIFYIHGFPGCRLEAGALDSIGKTLNARIIAMDRPGLGWSSPQPNRTLLDYPKDLQHLASHLNIPSYGIIGISGGGPYALACAYALPRDQLRAVTVVCGLGCPDMGYSGMRYPNRLGWGFSQRYLPSITRWWISNETIGRKDLTDEQRWEQWRTGFLKSTHPKDLEIAKDEDELKLSLRCGMEALSQGYEGYVQDSIVLSSPFGFRIEDIRKDLPVRVWHGTDDTNVPLQHGQKVAARIGENANLRVEDETHATIWFNWKPQIIEDLLKVM